jgi:hypothetical protein
LLLIIKKFKKLDKFGEPVDQRLLENKAVRREISRECFISEDKRRYCTRMSNVSIKENF